MKACLQTMLNIVSHIRQKVHTLFSSYVWHGSIAEGLHMRIPTIHARKFDPLIQIPRSKSTNHLARENDFIFEYNMRIRVTFDGSTSTRYISKNNGRVVNWCPTGWVSKGDAWVFWCIVVLSIKFYSHVVVAAWYRCALICKKAS